MTKPIRHRISFDFNNKESAKDFFDTCNEISEHGDLALIQKDSLHDANFKIVHWLVRTNNTGNGRKVD